MSHRGRPPLDQGTYGKIWVSNDGQPYKARASYRDRDGIVRTVARFGQTKDEAKRRLRAALADRTHAADHGGLTANSTVAELADAWLACDDVTRLAPNSIATYASVVANHVKPGLRGLRLSELRARDVNQLLERVRDKAGPGAAKTTKAALSGMCRLAVSYEAMPTNLMRDAIRVRGGSRKPPRRALTVDEETGLFDLLRTDQAAIDLDMPDLVEWLFGTGARIGEALACRDGFNGDGEPLLDLDAGTWEVNATLIRIKGRGLVVQERTKSDAGWRRIALPDHLVEMVRGRRERLMFRPDVPVLFPSPRSRSLRDPRNTSRDWRDIRTRLGYEWANFHKARSTVASRLLAAGIDPARVADHLGHARASMTLDFYAGRNVVSADAARILAR